MNANERAAEFQRAVDRLGEALTLSAGNPLGIDASIQRFEFCMELAWKTLRDILLRDHGIDVASPKPTMQEAFCVGLIDDETLWLSMLRDRNLSPHNLPRSVGARHLRAAAGLPAGADGIRGRCDSLTTRAETKQLDLRARPVREARQAAESV